MKATTARQSTEDTPPSTMIEALGLEVAAIKKSGGSTWVELCGGTFVALTNGQGGCDNSVSRSRSATGTYTWTGFK